MSVKRRSRVREYAEYLYMVGVERLVRLLPIGAHLGLGRVLGALTRLADRGHRRVAEENAAWALGLSPEEARALVRRVYRNVCTNFVEDLMLPKILRKMKLTDFSRVEGAEHLRAALARGKGAIVVTGHFGNWELAGRALGHTAGSALVVARTLSNRLVEERARRFREEGGLKVIGRQGALRQVLSHLRAGGCVAMLIDQNQRKGGVFVPFFGKLASTVPSPASLALKLDVPVLAGYTYREGHRLFHCFHCDPPFELIRTGDHKADVVANTAMFTQRIEEFVRKHPDQWFWLHSRWRKRPPGEAPGAGAEAPEDDDGGADSEGSDLE
ncbi:MAG TPA: lysophospholipid acyltransferase family protein [Planctomycetota bacterium]|nr:lysophospholipid acyltransferase family protein [Planctomycetota bacterium]HRR78771.1 lysophospholipid acyltransferase family protein [Planctomycetota bacterium]HRT97394.1 lysophospholipid acyltransferase family protein [Planctomycetota bacterium]